MPAVKNIGVKFTRKPQKIMKSCATVNDEKYLPIRFEKQLIGMRSFMYIYVYRKSLS